LLVSPMVYLLELKLNHNSLGYRPKNTRSMIW